MLFTLDENDLERKKSKDALVKMLDEMEKNVKPLSSQIMKADLYLMMAEEVKVLSKLSIISVYILLHYGNYT